MDNFSAWPGYVDDDGSLSLGTTVTKALLDAIRASVADNLYSATNPLVKTKTIIDEVIAARGTLADLATRLAVSFNTDGTLKPSVYPRIIASGYAGTQGFGAFYAANNAKIAVVVPANTLALDGDVLIVEGSGAETAANKSGMGVAIEATLYSVLSAGAAALPMTLAARIVRVSAIAVQIQGVTTGVGALGITSGAPLAVADLAANPLTLTIGMNSDSGAGTASKLYHYSVTKYGKV